jgi:hypothetical protein
MKCGFCNQQIVPQNTPLPELKTEPVRVSGSGRWAETIAAVVCPFCDSILGFLNGKANGA